MDNWVLEEPRSAFRLSKVLPDNILSALILWPVDNRKMRADDLLFINCIGEIKFIYAKKWLDQNALSYDIDISFNLLHILPSLSAEGTSLFLVNADSIENDIKVFSNLILNVFSGIRDDLETFTFNYMKSILPEEIRPKVIMAEILSNYLRGDIEKTKFLINIAKRMMEGPNRPSKISDFPNMIDISNGDIVRSIEKHSLLQQKNAAEIIDFIEKSEGERKNNDLI